jgi:CRISPR-associated protein Cmr5
MQQPETQTQQGQPVTRRQNMEQKRGKQAWKDIEFIKKGSQDRGNDTLQKEYRARASGLNAMIQINGLGQTLGFLKAKGKDKDDKGKPVPPNAYYYLLSHLTQWMRSISFDPAIPDRHDGLLKWVTDVATSASYRRATTECLAFGTWLRHFAEAELKAPSPPEPSETPHKEGGQ